SKRNPTPAVDSPRPASKRHFLTASRTALASTGCPPISFTSLIDPLAATVIITLTTPERFMRLASSGYTGATLLFAFRLISSCPHARGALVAIHPPISSRPTANTRFRACIDTVPPSSLCIYPIFVQGPHQRIPKVLSVHYFSDLCKAMKNRSLAPPRHTLRCPGAPTSCASGQLPISDCRMRRLYHFGDVSQVGTAPSYSLDSI